MSIKQGRLINTPEKGHPLYRGESNTLEEGVSFYRDTISGKVDKNEGKITPEKGHPLYRGNPILLRSGVLLQGYYF